MDSQEEKNQRLNKKNNLKIIFTTGEFLKN